jgi:hypothetical protein
VRERRLVARRLGAKDIPQNSNVFSLEGVRRHQSSGQ